MIARIPIRNQFYIGMALIYVVSLIVRITYAVYCPQELTFDEPYYDHIAHQILGGHGFTFDFSAWFTSIPNQPSSVQEPIYPLFLALMEKVFGANHIVGARIVQAFVGAIIPVGIGILGSQIFNYKSGFLASSVLAVYPPVIFFGHYLMTETLYMFFFGWCDISYNVSRSFRQTIPNTCRSTLGFGLLNKRSFTWVYSHTSNLDLVLKFTKKQENHGRLCLDWFIGDSGSMEH